MSVEYPGREQHVKFPGNNTYPLQVNPRSVFTQITIRGRDTGSIKIQVRPLLEEQNQMNFVEADWEDVTGGTIDLEAPYGQRTVTVENKKLSYVRFVDASPGQFEVTVLQWNAGG